MLVAQAFAEEANRCRSMLALQARRWAALGMGVLVLDPFGTGDSAGEFVEADWAGWKADLQLGVAWLRQHGQGCRTVLGVRLGALMATELAHEDPGLDRLLFWQPALDGKKYFTQFLRIRIAADLQLADRVKSGNELRARLADGQSIQVSGYVIGSALGQAIDAARLPADGLAGRSVDWFDIAAPAAAAPSPGQRSEIAALEAAGCRVRWQGVEGPAFWQEAERLVAPALVDGGEQRVRGWLAHGAVPSRAVAGDIVVDETSSRVGAVETPLVFDCQGEQLAGILHSVAEAPETGMVVVVAGGPQYRAGAHRQWVGIARRVAALGCPVLRFDLRGMGDSSGEHLGYQQSLPDIRAAIDELVLRQPSVRRVVLLGECESASGILFYGWSDPRVAGAVLTNPWVRTAEGQAQVILKNYYWDRLRSPQFWRRLRNGQFNYRESFVSLVDVLRRYARGRGMRARPSGPTGDDLTRLPLPVGTAEGLRRFKGQALLLMSGNDYIAREFDEVSKSMAAWKGLLDRPTVQRCDIDGADHTFSREAHQLAAWEAVLTWIRQLMGQARA